MADKFDMVKREGLILAGSIRIASYRVRDPDTGRFGPLQFHMTSENIVLGILPQNAASLFADFVRDEIERSSKRGEDAH